MFTALIINNNYHCRLKHTLKTAVFIFLYFIRREIASFSECNSQHSALYYTGVILKSQQSYC